MNQKMTPMELREEIIDFLKEHKDASLATCLNIVPRSSPVQYFLGDDLEIYILSAGGSKFEALQKNPNACLLVHTEYHSYRRIKGVQVFGKAVTSLENPHLFDEAKRFSPDPHLMEAERENLKVIKIIPDEIVYLNSLEDGDRTKQILRNNQVIVREDRIPVLM